MRIVGNVDLRILGKSGKNDGEFGIARFRALFCLKGEGAEIGVSGAYDEMLWRNGKRFAVE